MFHFSAKAGDVTSVAADSAAAARTDLMLVFMLSPPKSFFLLQSAEHRNGKIL
jgi:hypothetical protein